MVSQWDDKSGNGNNATQAIGTRQPATGTKINELNTVTFDGTADHMNFTDKTVAQNINKLSMYAVVRRTGGHATSGTVAAFCKGTPDYRYARSGLFTGSANIIAGGRRLDSDSYQSHDQAYTAADVNMIGAIFDYANAELYLSLIHI